MFKKIRPTAALAVIPEFPHCDQRILHAPGECRYCDELPLWQQLRIQWGIAFTNYEPEEGELPCPANYARGENCNIWGGNKAKPKDVIKLDARGEK